MDNYRFSDPWQTAYGDLSGDIIPVATWRSWCLW